jgi:transcriptional regulator of heat shock response
MVISQIFMELKTKKAVKKAKASMSLKGSVAAVAAKVTNIEPTSRTAQILAAIVREYANTAQPVGSAEITAKYKLKVSPATIRNEMAVLEKSGYIEQPHTSAGRVPTDKGYRFFVNELMRRVEMSAREQQLLRGEILQLQQKYQELGKEMSRSLARLIASKTDQAAFALMPEDSFSAGFSNILMHPGVDKNELVEVSEFFENIDQRSEGMLHKYLTGKSETLIGAELTAGDSKKLGFPQIPKNYSMIVSKVQLPSGKEGVIGIVGPKSMRYDKNISMLDYIAKLLSGGLLMTLVFAIHH